MTDQTSARLRKIPWLVPDRVPVERQQEYRSLVLDYLAAPHALSSSACKIKVLGVMGLLSDDADPGDEHQEKIADPAEPAKRSKKAGSTSESFPVRRPDGSIGIPGKETSE